MNRQDIIRMAREAGDTYCCDYPDDWLFDEDQLERFAAIVAAAAKAEEREACAQACNQLADDMTLYAQWGANTCATAIRARGDIK